MRGRAGLEPAAGARRVHERARALRPAHPALRSRLLPADKLDQKALPALARRANENRSMSICQSSPGCGWRCSARCSNPPLQCRDRHRLGAQGLPRERGRWSRWGRKHQVRYCGLATRAPSEVRCHRWEICVEKRYVHLQSHARDEHTSTAKILDQGVNRLRLAVPSFALRFVVEQESLWIGLVCPAKHLLQVLRSLLGKSNAGLVLPERVMHISVLVQSFVDDVPREDVPGVVSHHSIDVLLKKRRQLPFCNVTLRRPIRIVASPDRAVSPDLHWMRLREANPFIGQPKINRWLDWAAIATTSSHPLLPPCCTRGLGQRHTPAPRVAPSQPPSRKQSIFIGSLAQGLASQQERKTADQQNRVHQPMNSHFPGCHGTCWIHLIPRNGCKGHPSQRGCDFLQ